MSDIEHQEFEDDEEDWTDTSWADPHVQVNLKVNQGKPSITGDQAELKSTNGDFMKTASNKASCNPTEAITHQSENTGNGNGGVVERMLLNDNKAGMEGLDKDKINQIILEASKGSKFYENERLKEEQMKKRIQEQKEKIRNISEEKLQEGMLEADQLLQDFEQQRDLSHTIVHIDMDAFYAAVEMRDRPELKDKPMAVGGSAMLSTSNYHARKFGVRAAMPGFIGKKLCPDLIIVPTNFEKYTSVSKQVKEIIADYDPNYCPMSLDEAYLDITEHLLKRRLMSSEERTFLCRDSTYAHSRAHCLCDLNEVLRHYGSESISLLIKQRSKLRTQSKSDGAKTEGNVDVDANQAEKLEENADEKHITNTCQNCKNELPPFEVKTFGQTDEDAVHELRTRIEQKTRLTASAGIAPNMMLAKVCSDKNKPNGQYKIPANREDVMTFIQDLPTRKISGIGKVSEAMLNAVGVFKCSDLYAHRGLLYHLYSSISFNYFMRICLGIGSTTVERDTERKSMSTERTFSEINRPADLYMKCEELCAALSEDLKSEELKGRTVSIKIKTVKFEVRTRAHSLRDYTNETEDIFRAASSLLKTEIENCSPQPLRLRLMGVRMSSLLHESLCKDRKQNTIMGAFKRQAQLSKCESSSKLENADIVKINVQMKSVHGKSRNEVKEANVEEMDTDIQVVQDVCQHLEVEVNKNTKMTKEVNENPEMTKCESDIDKVDDVSSEDNSTFYQKNEKETSMVLDVVEDSNSDKLIKLKDYESGNIMITDQRKVVNGLEPVLSTHDQILSKKEVVSRQPHLTIDKPVLNLTCAMVEKENTSDQFVQNKLIKKEIPEEQTENVIVINEIIPGTARKTRSGVNYNTPTSSSTKRKRGSVKKGSGVQKTYVCPICGRTVICKGLREFNSHVDECLESGGEQAQTSKTSLRESGSTEKQDGVVPKPCSDFKENLESLTEEKAKTDVEDWSSDNCVKTQVVFGQARKLDTEMESVDTDTTMGNTQKPSETIKITEDILEEIQTLSCRCENLVKYESSCSSSNMSKSNYDYPTVSAKQMNMKSSSKSSNYIDKSNRVTNAISEQIIQNNARMLESRFGKGSENEISLIEQAKHNIKIEEDSVRESINKNCVLNTGDRSIRDKSNKVPYLNKSSEGGTSDLIYTDFEMPERCAKDTKLKATNEHSSDVEGDACISVQNDIVERNINCVSKCKISEKQNSAAELIINGSADKVPGYSMKSNSQEVEAEFKSNDSKSPNNKLDELHRYECAPSTSKSCSFQDLDSVDYGANGEEVEMPGDRNLSGNDADTPKAQKEKSGSLLVCPVCNIEQRLVSLNEFNQHVDSCLSKGTITEILKEQRKVEMKTSKRSRHPSTPAPLQPAKKRKTSFPGKPPTCRSILTFFQK